MAKWCNRDGCNERIVTKGEIFCAEHLAQVRNPENYSRAEGLARPVEPPRSVSPPHRNEVPRSCNQIGCWRSPLPGIVFCEVHSREAPPFSTQPSAGSVDQSTELQLSKTSTDFMSEAEILLTVFDGGFTSDDGDISTAEFVRDALRSPRSVDIRARTVKGVDEDGIELLSSFGRRDGRYDVAGSVRFATPATLDQPRADVELKAKYSSNSLDNGEGAYVRVRVQGDSDMTVNIRNTGIRTFLQGEFTPDRDHWESLFDEFTNELFLINEVYFPVSKQSIQYSESSAKELIKRLAREVGAMLGEEVTPHERFGLLVTNTPYVSPVASAATSNPLRSTEPTSKRGSNENLPALSQSFERERLNGRDFSNRDLRGSEFHRCDLTGCNFSGSNLEGIRMTQCTIDRTNFERANLQRVKFFGLFHSFERGPEVAGSTLKNCSFNGADIRKAMFAGCDVAGSSFGGADLRGTDFRGTASDPPLPDGIAPMDAKNFKIDATQVRWDSSTVWPSRFRP